jgi:hypothetical protein
MASTIARMISRGVKNCPHRSLSRPSSKETFVDLGQGKYVSWIHRLVTDLVDLIQDVEEIPLGVNAYPLDAFMISLMTF